MEKIWTIHDTKRDALTGFITEVHWRLALRDGEYYADTYSVQTYEQDREDFVPFEEINTQQVIIDWLIETLGEDRVLQMEKSLEDQIERLKNPPVLSGLPWEVQNQSF